LKFLIDECLSAELAHTARRAGHPEASHVAWIGKRGWKDWELKRILLDGDWVFVTRNSVDFRGSSKSPGARGQFADVPIHAGLVCLNGPPAMNLDLQMELFSAALEELEGNPDLVNQVLEITCAADASEIDILRYDLPSQN